MFGGIGSIPGAVIGAFIIGIMENIIKGLPAAWDESLLVEGNPTSFATVARRKGNDWWVSGISVISWLLLSVL